MTDDFDPYRDWLGIATPQRPPSHYALLGLPEFEVDAIKIAAAADARMREVRSYQTGPRGRFTQKLLNELAAAKLCLLEPRSKAAYDSGLSARSTATLPFYAPPPSPPAGPPPPVAPPPLSQTIPAPPVPTPRPRAPDDEPALPHERSQPWWLPVGILFVLIILAASGGMYVYSKRAKQAPPVVIEEPAEDPAPMEEPELFIAQEGSGDLNLPNSVAELSGGVTAADRGGETYLETWNGADAVARWKFKLVRPAIFQVRLKYEAARAGAAQWQFRIGNETKTRDLQSGTITDEFFWRIPRGGQHELELTISGLPDDGQVQLQSVRFIFQGGELK
jgi:hypothetical protein